MSQTKSATHFVGMGDDAFLFGCLLGPEYSEDLWAKKCRDESLIPQPTPRDKIYLESLGIVFGEKCKGEDLLNHVKLPKNLLIQGDPKGDPRNMEIFDATKGEKIAKIFVKITPHEKVVKIECGIF